jgi:hypothetical protein
LLVLAEKSPEKIRRRVLQRPAAFSRLPDLDDAKLDEVLLALDGGLIGKAAQNSSVSPC